MQSFNHGFRRGCLAAVAMAVAIGWASAVPAAELLTPEGAVTAALLHHPLVRVAEADSAAAEAGDDAARSGYLPRVDFVEDVARSNNPVFAFGSKLGQERFAVSDFAIDSLNAPDPITNAATRVTLRQNVWDGGLTAGARRAATGEIGAAAAASERTREALTLGALRAFWDAVLADAMQATAIDAEAAARSNAESAAARVEEGLGVPSDRMQAEVRLAEIRALRFRAAEGVAVARAALCRAVGAPPGTEYELVPPLVAAPDEIPAADFHAENALASRADLRVYEARVGQAQAAEDMMKAGRRPQIGLQAQYEWNADRPFGNDGNNWTVGVALRIPVFDGLQAKAGIAQARAGLARVQALRSEAQSAARLEILSAASALRSAAERLLTAEGAVNLAAEALRIVRERYDEGLAVMTELLGAEAARTQARAALALAVHDLALARAGLDFALGRPIAARADSGKE